MTDMSEFAEILRKDWRVWKYLYRDPVLLGHLATAAAELERQAVEIKRLRAELVSLMRYSSPPKRRHHSGHKKGDPVAASVASGRAPPMEEVADVLEPTKEKDKPTTNKKGLSHKPIAPFPLNEEREADELRDSLVAHGRTARRLGFGIDRCPPFKDPDMAEWWRIGWRREAE